MKTAPEPASGPWFIFQTVGRSLTVLLSAVTALVVLSFLLRHDWHMPISTSRAIIGAWPQFNNWALLVHIFTAIPCLLVGPVLFARKIRERYPALHRTLGKCYVTGVLISAILGFLLASVNTFGIVARAGFISLSVVWFWTTLQAYLWIRRSDFVRHRQWMIRSYAVSLAVVSVRFLDVPDGMTREQWYPVMTWLCWVPNVILGELYVRCTTHLGRFCYRPGTTSSGDLPD